jgi:hypothetical protein
MPNVGRAKSIKLAAETLADFNTFAIIETILKGAHLQAASNDGARKIIRICQVEQRKRLLEYTRAVAKVMNSTDG